jgi:hypothetical protein
MIEDSLRNVGELLLDLCQADVRFKEDLRIAPPNLAAYARF